MVVVDSSALVYGVADTTDRGKRARMAIDDAVAPHLVDAEVGQALRRLVLRGALDEEAARRSLHAAGALVTDRYPHRPLTDRAWELRNSVSFYDALYVALAEALAVPLVTADEQLTRADGPTCELDLV